jgi:hypothetical protein
MGSFRSDESNNPINVFWKHPHSPVAKRIENCIRQRLFAQLILDIGMHENVDRARKSQLRETLTTDPIGFLLINESDSASRHGIGNRCRLTVVQSHLRGAHYKLLEIPLSFGVKLHDFNVPCVDKFVQKVSVPPLTLPTLFQLSGHNVDDGHAVRQSLDYPLGAACRIHAYDRARVCNKESLRVS